MAKDIGRRSIFTGALGAGLFVGLGAGQNALAADAPRDAPADGAADHADPVIPVVPGMSGNRRANQMWYDLDQVGYYQPSSDFVAAIVAVGQAVGNPDVETGMAELWFNARVAGTYPDSFISTLEPVKDQLKLLSDTESSVFYTYYGTDPRGLVQAVADFGQGTLFDPRRPGNEVHTMNGNPPDGYHSWHGFNRAFAFLGIEPRFWNDFDPVVAFGWAVQSTAKPSTDELNPALPDSVIRQLARTWLHMSPEQIDDAFMSFPYPVGIS